MKISEKEWIKMAKYNNAKKWIRPFCVYTLSQLPNGNYKRMQSVHWLLYIFIIIPVCIIEIFYCIWECGLKNYEFPERHINSVTMHPETDSGKIAKEIIKQRNK